MNTSVFQAAPEFSARAERKSEAELVEICLVRTAEALSATGVAGDSDIFKALEQVRTSQSAGKPMELIETLARVLGHEEEHIAPIINGFSDAVASTLHPIPPSIPFASKLIAPSAFYDSFESMHRLGKRLLTPVIFAEDTDAIGMASVNPIAAAMLGDEIHYTVGKRFGIRPFITTSRMDYESWAFLCRKHFEL